MNWFRDIGRDPKKELPEFELVDLSGKTWRLKDLRGKSVLIQVWATWCGPCRTELPHIQDLYARLGSSPDLQILTLNIDDDLGIVEPYLKENNFKFPVLPANGFVFNLSEGSVGIPQIWIIDANGKWQWTESGFALTDWEETLMSKLKGDAAH
jgi:thiol-disulfide isomerase/thioredoxin